MSEFTLLPTSKFIMHDGQLCLDSESIGIALGYETPRVSVNKIYHRNKAELDPFSSVVNLTTEAEVSRSCRVFTEEGIYIISMLANTSKASQFRVELAKFLKAYRQNQLKKSNYKCIEVSKSLYQRLSNLKLLPGHAAIISNLNKNGYPSTFIAKALGCSPYSIRRVLKDIRVIESVCEKLGVKNV